MKQLRWAQFSIRRGLVTAFLTLILEWGGGAAAASPPTVPVDFQATVKSGSAVVTLHWGAATAEVGIQGYRLERSFDQLTWELVAEPPASPYEDASTSYGLRYFYRLRAVDMAGENSGWTAAEVTTPELGTNGAGGSSALSLVSADRLLTITLPAGAAKDDVTCKLTRLSGVNGKTIGTSDQPLIAGPYSLSCTTTAGSVVTSFGKPAIWQFKLKDLVKGKDDPGAYTYDDKGTGTRDAGSHFDDASQTLTATLPATSTVAVLAAVPHPPSFNLLAIILVVLALGGGVAVLIWNRQKKLAYEEHMRSKYYDL